MNRSLIIPVENQVRELDAKLLLACIAARHEFSVIIGSRLEISFRIGAFPPSIYLAKSMTARSLKMFRIMRKLGHVIAGWDEEALIHPPAETYFTRRLSPEAIAHVSHLFAWGEENAELWRQYPSLPPDMPIHLTGNSRGDMLRPEMQPFFAEETEQLRRKYGEFLLINTNFSFVNAFYPDQNLFQPVKNPGEKPRFGRAAVGMDRHFAEGLRDHKQAVFESFQAMIPRLEQAFPELTIIVRPHPVENPAVYHRLAAGCRRVKVINEGNVIPWLLASRAVIHNGCTTGVEAYIMRVPALSYQEHGDPGYDNGFYRLPNVLSHQCYDFSGLRESISSILAGKMGAAGGRERRELMAGYLASQDGPLASRRIVEALEKIIEESANNPLPLFFERFTGRFQVSRRRLAKTIKSFQPNSKYRPEFQRHRYPGLSTEELSKRIKRLQSDLGYYQELDTEKLGNHVFRITPGQPL
ncbi:MAG: surface carbohydrate biosynthesis protein [Pseudomonadota bacterium]|nr:surface carbohydrate biosynthesis protein [Pseudomonadota bacterium]